MTHQHTTPSKRRLNEYTYERVTIRQVHKPKVIPDGIENVFIRYEVTISSLGYKTMFSCFSRKELNKQLLQHYEVLS